MLGSVDLSEPAAILSGHPTATLVGAGLLCRPKLRHQQRNLAVLGAISLLTRLCLYLHVRPD